MSEDNILSGERNYLLSEEIRPLLACHHLSSEKGFIFTIFWC